MLPNKGKPDSWRKTLKLISHCPVCNHDYQSEAVRLFASGGEAKFVHFTCGSCKGYFMAMIVNIPKGISTVGMVTDLSFEDLQKLHNVSPVSIDETIEGYQFINSSDFHPALVGKKSV